MSQVHVLCSLSCVLFVAGFACDQIYHILGFACQIVPHIVGHSSVSTCELIPLLQPGTQQTFPPSSPMTVLKATRRIVTDITAISVWKIFQGVPAEDLLQVLWLAEGTFWLIWAQPKG